MRVLEHAPPVRMALAAAVLALPALGLACGGGDKGAAVNAASAAGSMVPVAVAKGGSVDGEPSTVAGLGDGFVVWESNRDGNWRIWTRELTPESAPRRLSPDEPGRVHCCPDISPDGRWLAYLSLPPGGEAYRPGRTTGPLRLLDLTTGEDRMLAPAARNYYENRAVVWRGAGELVFIDGDGHTLLLDLANGKTRRLTERPASEHGWLIDPGLAFATKGRPSFSPYDPERRAISERAVLGGCQPYFSSDGRWGFFVAGAGGPIDRVDLAGGSRSTILRKNDPRMVDGYGYAYFPMFSTDRRALVYAASPGQHDHVKADYEVFIIASDPATLELAGRARRLTHHPATDRFPDVFLAPQPLGQHDGEAPFAVELVAESLDGDWIWRFGDGATNHGAVGRHVYAEPGLYRVEARRDGELLTGTVRVRPARPPKVTAVELGDGGREVRVRLDEEVEADELRIRFTSGLVPESWSLASDHRALAIRLAEPLALLERLELDGLRDRAGRPNAMPPVSLEIEPPLWPAREGAVFVWQTGDAPNLFYDAAAGVDRAGLVEPAGRAFLDREHRMTLRGGVFTASADDSNRLRWALQASNEMTLELTVEPALPSPDRAGGERALVMFGQRGQPYNFALLERNGELLYRHRVAPRGDGMYARAPLGALGPGRRHLVVSYRPGRLTLDLDGERVVETSAIQGDFFHWRSLRLAFGGQAGGGLEWQGTIEGLALYDRALSAAEARESFLRYRRLLERRPVVPELVVEARLTARSPTPTLEEIRPYRQGLAVHEYEIERVLAGDAPAGPLRVAHRELLDGARQPAAGRRAGDRVTLRLEPFADQRQIAALYVSNQLGAPPRFFAIDGD